MNITRIIFLAAVVLLGERECFSQSISWNGHGDGTSWSDSNNWTGLQVPGPNNTVFITNSGGGTVVITNDVSVKSILCSNVLNISSGSLAVTSGASFLRAELDVASDALLSASASGTTLTSSGAVVADDANFTVSGGAVMTLPGLKNYNKGCYGANWLIADMGSVLNLPGLTNITGQACNYPAIEAEVGGQVLLTNLATIQAGPLAFNADGTNSLIDLSGLDVCAGQNGYMVTFEASSGGTVRIPRLTGGVLLGVTLNPGGTIPTGQIQMLNTLELLGVTNNFNALTNLANLTVTGVTMSFPALDNFDDGNVMLSGGAVVTMPALTAYAKFCNGANWTVTGSNSELNLPALTTITGQACNYPAMQAEAGGRILAPNVTSIEAGPLAFNADGSYSLINLSGLTTCAGQQGYLVTFEASAGGTVNIPNMAGGPLLGLTINPGGTIPTAQIRMLNTLNLPGVTNNFNLLTNLVNLTISGVTMNFPDLVNFDDGNVTASGGAVVTLPTVKSFTKLSCYGDNWTATGAGTIVSFPALTNITGVVCNFPIIQAEAGGEILAANVASVNVAPLTIQADGTGSLIDLSGLTTCSGQDGYSVSFEASSGGNIKIPNMYGGPLTGVTINPGGTIPTAQIRMLTSLNLPGVTNNFNSLTNVVNLTVTGVTMNFPALDNFDDGNITVSGGGSVTMPVLTNFTKLSCYGANWTVTGAGSVLNLPELTNITGEVCSYPVIQAEAGGQIFATNLAGVELGPLTFQADGTGSLIDLANLTNAAGADIYYLAFEASGGGTLQLPKLANAQLVSLAFNAGGTLAPTNLASFTLGSITLPGGALTLPVLRELDESSLNVSGGGVLSAPEVGSYSGGFQVGAKWQANGAGSEISLAGLTNLTGDTSASYPTQIEANSGGEVLLNDLQSVANGNIAFVSDGAGSAINLSGLSGFVLQNGQGSVTATNTGNILLNNQAFLLANVAINIPAGNPVLPPTLIASASLTLYGQAGHSYLVEKRNTLIPNSPFTFLARVPLTNSFEAIAPSAPANTAYLVSEFVANPPVLSLSAVSNKVQLVLYGLTNGAYEIQTTTNLAPANWTNFGSVTMTNAFRIFPPTPPLPGTFYYRAKQE